MNDRKVHHKAVAMLLVSSLIVSMVACSAKKDSENIDREKPVKVNVLKEEQKDITIAYTGNVNVKDTRTFAFKSPGKIVKVVVEKGQQIRKGDVLARLDTTDLSFAVEAARGQVEAVNSQYQKALSGATKEDIQQLRINVSKAEDAFQYTDELYGKMQQLYDSGAIAKNELDKVKLERDVRNNDLNQAKVALQTALNGTRKEDIAMARANLSMAQTDLAYKESQIKDASIISDMDGYVAEIIQKEGSFVSAGYPVIALRGDAQVIKTGIARQDMDKVHLGSKVIIMNDTEEYQGMVTYLSDIPDTYTRTYEAEITPETGNLSIGSIVEMNIVVGSESGIWIPISAMMSDGKDYVFVAEEKKPEKDRTKSQTNNQAKDETNMDGENKDINQILAIRRDIVIQSTKGAYAKVEGLSPGSRLIIEGMRSIKDKQLVKLIGE